MNTTIALPRLLAKEAVTNANRSALTASSRRMVHTRGMERRSSPLERQSLSHRSRLACMEGTVTLPLFGFSCTTHTNNSYIINQYKGSGERA